MEFPMANDTTAKKDVLRKILREHPEYGAKEVAADKRWSFGGIPGGRMLGSVRTELKISSGKKRKKVKRRRPGKKAASSGRSRVVAARETPLTVADLKAARTFVAAVGGFDTAKATLSALEAVSTPF